MISLFRKKTSAPSDEAQAAAARSREDGERAVVLGARIMKHNLDNHYAQRVAAAFHGR